MLNLNFKVQHLKKLQNTVFHSIPFYKGDKEDRKSFKNCTVCGEIDIFLHKWFNTLEGFASFKVIKKNLKSSTKEEEKLKVLQNANLMFLQLRNFVGCTCFFIKIHETG